MQQGQRLMEIQHFQVNLMEEISPVSFKAD